MQVLIITLTLIFIAAIIFGIREKLCYMRFQKYLDMDIRIQFYDAQQAVDAYKRGSIVLELRDTDAHIKSVVITQLRFSNPALQVTTLDNIYFKARTDKPQVLSVSFRTRRRDLQDMNRKHVRLYIRGRMTDQQGQDKVFKAKVPSVLDSSNDAMSRIEPFPA
ncbi:hypothetical protein [Sphingobacterium suaedae]